MRQVTIEEARQRWPDLLAAAEAGETVMIRGDEGLTFALVVQRPAHVLITDWPGYPYAGSAKGLIEVPEDFGEPLEALKEYMQ